MCIYSFTKIYELPGNYMNTRLRNICEQRGMVTVYDLWKNYRGHSSYRGIQGFGKKSALMVRRIIHKADEVMDVMPLTTCKQAPGLDPLFTLTGFYEALDETGKEMADNVFRRLATRMRSHARNWLEDACGDLTLGALTATLNKKKNPRTDKKRTNPGSREEVGDMLYALKIFFQSDAWRDYMAKPALTLLRQDVMMLSQCLSSRMDDMLVANRERIGLATFPLGYYISTYLNTTTSVPYGLRSRLATLCDACRANLPTAGKLWDQMREENIAAWVLPAVALLERRGYTVPAYYRLPDAPYHTGDVKGQAVYRGFENVFLLLVYNPGYRIVNYRTEAGRNVMLVKDKLAQQFDFAGLLREVYRMKNDYIPETYKEDLYTLMVSFFEEESPAEEEDRLTDVTAAMIRDVYDMVTDGDKQLELKRTSKLQTHEHIEAVLQQRGTPCTADEMEQALDNRGVILTRETVKKHLTSNELFVRMGADKFGMKGWKMEPEATVRQSGAVIMMVTE